MARMLSKKVGGKGKGQSKGKQTQEPTQTSASSSEECLCAVCKKQYKSNTRLHWIQCDTLTCQKWVHIRCIPADFTDELEGDIYE